MRAWIDLMMANMTYRDSLRKHWKSCFLRKTMGYPMPKPEVCGRKRRSCDQCATSKRACNFESPCSTCSSKGSSCSYQRMSPQQMTAISSCDTSWIDEAPILGQLDHWPESDSESTKTTNHPESLPLPTPLTMAPLISPNYPSLILQQAARWTYLRTYETESFEFLLNMAPCNGLDRTFNFQTSSEKGHGNWQSDNFMISEDLLDINSCQWQDSKDPTHVIRVAEWLFDPLLPQTKKICEKLLLSSGQAGAGTNSRTQSLTEECIEFFNPRNIHRLLGLYWKRWHWNCPIIHPSSFEPTQAPAELIMVMTLIGACVSEDAQDVQMARKWLDSAERLIFSLPWLSQENSGSHMDISLTQDTKLGLLQTAILISVLQTWEGSDLARSRIRKCRYPYVAQASQDLVIVDFTAISHPWGDFIFEEQLIRYGFIASVPLFSCSLAKLWRANPAA